MRQLVIIIIAIISFMKVSRAQVLERDSLALIDFYNSMDGPNWNLTPNNDHKWDSTKPVGDWAGVSINNGRVTGIRFWGWQGISGNLPESFGNLDSLSVFTIFDNYIGSLPASFVNLKQLSVLQLRASYGGPSQTFPMIVLSLTNLNHLDLGQNSLTGYIPEEIGNLHKLTYLDLTDNFFKSTIPASFKNLTSLQFVDLGANQVQLYSSGLSAGLENIPTQNLKTLHIYGHYFNFNVIESLAKHNSISEFFYAPQENINLVTINGRLAAPAGGSVSNNTYKWYKEGIGLIATIVGDSTFQASSYGNYYAEVNNSIATDLTLTSNAIAAPSVVLNTCALQPAFDIVSNISGATYQWQQSIDSVSYVNIINNDTFAGAATSSLTLKNIPSSWYGRRYRCLTNNGTSTIFTLTFLDTWTGAFNTSWSNNTNWSCGNAPDANSDVIISSGTVIINSDVTVRTLTIKPGANVTVAPVAHLTVINQ